MILKHISANKMQEHNVIHKKKGSRLSGYWMGLNLLCYGAV